MGYTDSDFSECISCANRDGHPIQPEEIAAVEAAWGGPEEWDGWAGGFLLRLTDGTYAYLTGSCDYTGWG